MVVHTNTPRVQEAQEAVLEFLLINHPLDCPVCDKGGECPLQDKSFGWGGGISRFVEPKRHFEKPLALSPLIAIDRERCILCYRCVRFSQEVSEDVQLVLHDRGAAHVRRHVRRPSVRRAVQRQHHRAVPRRRAHLAALPLPRAAVGHRAVGLGLHALPGAVQRELHRPRRARAARAAARPRRGRRRLALRQGPLRLPGDPRRRARSPSRCCATAASCGRSPGTSRSTRRPPRSAAPARAPRRSPAARRRTRRASSCRRCCATRSARPTSTRAPGARWTARRRSRSRAPELQATVPDLQYAHAVLVVGTDPIDDAPILDLRIRKGVRHHGVRLFTASARPTALDPRAEATSLMAPGTRRGVAGRARRRARRPPRRGRRRARERRGRRRRRRPRDRRRAARRRARTS